ncbi:MAG: hypothetical protein HQK49_01390 [Oligoflexia bacterium]|nr:hypothetical protein [Oligoflexia bacterium]
MDMNVKDNIISDKNISSDLTNANDSDNSNGVDQVISDDSRDIVDEVNEIGEISEESEESEGTEGSESEDIGSADCKFKEGQAMTFVKVRFPGNAKAFPFFIGKRRFSYAQKVVAMSDRGMAIGYISSFPYEESFNRSMLPVRSIIKPATDKDVVREESYVAKEKDAKDVCNRLVEKLNLNMELTHVEYTQFGKKAVFYFTAPGRVDFRELVKGLVSELKMRIELRQIYIRDRTAAIGGIGPCGRQFCCNSFLEKYGHVNIKMAKTQLLTLTQNKLNGVCGQLKCCMQYEDDVYQDKKLKLPEIGSFIKAKNGDVGKVERLHILIEQFDMVTDKGKRRRYFCTQYDPNDEHNKNSRKLEFPFNFDYIADECGQVIGLENGGCNGRSSRLNGNNEDKSICGRGGTCCVAIIDDVADNIEVSANTVASASVAVKDVKDVKDKVVDKVINNNASSTNITDRNKQSGSGRNYNNRRSNSNRRRDEYTRNRGDRGGNRSDIRKSNSSSSVNSGGNGSGDKSKV